MKDYTEEIVIGENIFTLVLDEATTSEFCIIKKYAGIVEIRVQPVVIKIFSPEDIINFGAWKYLVICGTPTDELEIFIKDNFTPDTFIAMIAVSHNFGFMMLPVMELVDRINNESDTVRENKYKFTKMTDRMDILKSIGKALASSSEDEHVNDAPPISYRLCKSGSFIPDPDAPISFVQDASTNTN